MRQHIRLWYMNLSQFEEMKAHASLCKCVDSPEPLLPAYTKHTCRPELRQLSPLRWYGQLMLAFANMLLVPKSHMLVKFSFEHFIITLDKISNYCFHPNAIFSMFLLLSKIKFEIWFQYLVYYIIHTCNTYDNKYTVIYLIFMLSFSF